MQLISKKTILFTFLCMLLFSKASFAEEPKQRDLNDSSQLEIANINEAESQEWDADSRAKDYDISTLQTRRFSKSKRFEISPSLGVIASDIFVIYLPISLRFAYHFNEAISLELQNSFMGCFTSRVGPGGERAQDQACLRFLSPSYETLKNESLLGIRNISIKQWQLARFHLNTLWSPFFGKFSLANSHIIHFDLHVTAGLGLVLLESIDKDKPQEIKLDPAFEGNLGLGLKFFFLDFLGLRFDYRLYLFPKLEKKGLGTASEFSVGLSFLI